MIDRTTIGIDISKAKFDLCALKEQKTYKRVFQNTPSGFQACLKWILQNDLNSSHMCLESTGTYGDPLARFLFDQGFRISVVNPLRIKAYARCHMTRHKTDPVDAKLIAHFCQTQEPTLWAPPPTEGYQLRELTRCLSSLKSSREDFSNRLEKMNWEDKTIPQHYLNIRSKIEEEI
jgi:transposase